MNHCTRGPGIQKKRNGRAADCVAVKQTKDGIKATAKEGVGVWWGRVGTSGAIVYYVTRFFKHK